MAHLQIKIVGAIVFIVGIIFIIFLKKEIRNYGNFFGSTYGIGIMILGISIFFWYLPVFVISLIIIFLAGIAQVIINHD